MPTRDRWILVLLAAACAAVNLTKAVQIDDTAYLEIARALVRDPWHAMAAPLNWSNVSAPIARVNQPHLFFALEALIIRMFGESMLALHALAAAFTTLAIWAFHGLARRTVPARALWLTTLFALGPAVMPAQNLMVDVPLVGLWILVFLALSTASDPARRGQYGVAAAAMTAACLIKYPSLVLLPIAALTIAVRRQWSALWWGLVPVAVLVAWSAFNYADYGHVHILQRDVASRTLGMIVSSGLNWVVGLGAVAPFAALWWPRPPAASARVAGAALVPAVGLFVWMWSHGARVDTAVLWALFLGNGALTVALVARAVQQHWAAPSVSDWIWLLLGWLGGVTGFIVLLSPFMAVRHALLALPAVLLLLGSTLEPALTRRRRVAAVLVTATLGVALAVSDYQYAAVYRDAVPQIMQKVPAGVRVWSVGHWGWQWYSTEAGMKVYETGTNWSPGDYVVIPAIPDHQQIRPQNATRLEQVAQVVVPSGPLTWIRTMSLKPYGGYYYFDLTEGTAPPWRFSTEPLETFTISVVTDTPRP